MKAAKVQIITEKSEKLEETPKSEKKQDVAPGDRITFQHNDTQMEGILIRAHGDIFNVE